MPTVAALDMLNAIRTCIIGSVNGFSDSNFDSLPGRCDLLGSKCYLAILVTRMEWRAPVNVTLTIARNGLQY